MASLLDYYKTLGIHFGASMAEVTSSYKKLVRIHHPDISDDPESWELMKQINIAYTALREKQKREAMFRDRQLYARQARRYSGAEPRAQNAEPRNQNTEPRAQTADPRAQSADPRKAATDAEKEAYNVLNNYFRDIKTYDYSGAYFFLSSIDKRRITRESFIEWRKSVERLYPMREFKITGGLPIATVTWGEGRVLIARRFRVAVTEDNFASNETRVGDVEKLVIFENGLWKVFLGYVSVRELTRTFDERFETKRRNDIEKSLEEYRTELNPEYNMLSLTGMQKAISKEAYRQKRFGGTMTVAAISLRSGDMKSVGQEQLLRSTAKTIRKALRECDIPAYAGDGMFVLLLVELRRKVAEGIIIRLIERIRENAGPQLGKSAVIEYSYETFSDNNEADISSLNKVMRKFRKKV